MTEQLTLEEILKLNPHLRREEIELMRQLGEQGSGSRVPKKRPTAPDRLSVGESSPRKVPLRYSR